MISFYLFMLFASLFIALAYSRNDHEPKTDDDFPNVKFMIDTHIHLFDTGRPQGVPWPPKDDEVLYKPHLPHEFKNASQSTGLTGAIIVEASEYPEDNRWVLDLVKDDDYFIALVGNIDPYREDFESELLELLNDKRFVGVRARNPSPIEYSHPQVIKNFQVLTQHNLSLDFLANGEGVSGIKKADRLAKSIPELRIIFNHVLGHNIDGKQPDSNWIKAVQKLAENQNVFCKVSGLFQRSVNQPAPHDDQYYRPILDVLWDNFGHSRLIYGSNWPCTKISGDYTSLVQLVNRFFQLKGQDACEHYFWKNADKVYNLGLI